MTNIIYLRVSKQDLEGGKTEQQVLEDQLPPILKKFNLKEYIVLKEKGSAYNIDKIKQRTEFLKLLEFCFNSTTTTIDDLFRGNITSNEINVYVFDSNRLMRNIEFGMLFSILRSLFKVKLFSVNQENLNIEENDLIGQRMSKYLMGTVDSYLAEGYSQNISDHTKKSVRIKKGIKVSRYGNKWGKSLIDKNGKKLSLGRTKHLINRVNELIRYYEGINHKYYFNEIISKISIEFDILISKAYISKVKKNGYN